MGLRAFVGDQTNFLEQVGYTGSGAHKLSGLTNVNQPFPGTGNANARRPLNSTYEALLAKIERRFAKVMTLLASYTYGHSIDGGPSANDASDPGSQDARKAWRRRWSRN